MDEHDALCALIPLISKAGLRKSNDTDNEFSVVGPKVGFVEDLDINLHLLRSQFTIPNLIVKMLTVGSLSNSRVAIVYIDGIANKDNVSIVEQRLSSIDFEVVFDTSQLDQIISDNSLSPFPLFVSTERRDRVIYSLISGQVAVISDGSPYFITGPSTLYDFFISPEDYYLPWILGSFLGSSAYLVLFSHFLRLPCISRLRRSTTKSFQRIYCSRLFSPDKMCHSLGSGGAFWKSPLNFSAKLEPGCPLRSAKR